MSDIKIFASLIEDEAKKQIDIVARHAAFVDQKIRIMPDVHAGKGCVVGFTSTLGDFIIPNIVGVDLGCGMLTINLGNVDLDLDNLDNIINKSVPCGTNIHKTIVTQFKEIEDLRCWDHIKERWQRFSLSVGTLGSGNHFIEVDQDKEGNKYLVIHSGSRNLGKQVAEHYQHMAQSKMDKECPKDLAYLVGGDKDDYLHDVTICQMYAALNRVAIASIILSSLPTSCMINVGPESPFNTIHNYIDSDGIIRKGAISAKQGEKVLIPLNMRDGSILAIGKGNADWNYSAPHGAGRIMSRTKAKTSFTLDQYEESMKGVYTTSISLETLDELPMAYKPVNSIIDNIKDTVDIIGILRPIYNFKAK